MSAKFYALTHGGTGLLLAYVLVFVPLVVGLRRGRASLLQFVWSPLTAMVATFGAGIVVALTSPLLRPFGVSHDSLLQGLFGCSDCIGWLCSRSCARRTQGRPGQSSPPRRSHHE